MIMKQAIEYNLAKPWPPTHSRDVMAPVFSSRFSRRIAIIHGHPDPSERHLLHAMGDAYAGGAAVAGHEVRRKVAKLDFPLLRTQAEFETGATSGGHALGWALDIFISALAWHDAGAVQRLSRTHFSTRLCPEIQGRQFPETTVRGTLGPHRRDHGDACDALSLVLRRLRGARFRAEHVEVRRIKPIRESFYGLSFADDKKRARWIEDMRRHGWHGD
jgi:hypothetical protein